MNLLNRITYKKQIREMNAEELQNEYSKLISINNQDLEIFIAIIRKQYKQITGEQITQTIIN